MVDEQLLKKTKATKIVVFTLLFLVASIATFYGTRLTLPIITHYGRGTLTALPATFTFAIPLFTLIVLWQYSQTDTIGKRWRLNLIYSIVTITVATFNLIDLMLVLGLLYDWNLIVGVMTPIYPLDLILFNLIILAVGFASLFFTIANKKFKGSLETEGRVNISRGKHVLAGFFIAFATYFFGEALFGVIDIFEGFVDPNIVLVIPVYLAFLMLAVEAVVYVVYLYSPKESKLKRGLIGVITLLSISVLLFVWIVIGLTFNPYYFSESLQQEFAIGYSLKMPIGLFIIAAWVVIPSIVALIKFILRLNKSKKELKELEQNEQE